MPLLDLQGVTRRFGTLRALDDVTTAVEAGEIRGVIGPNGAGKTTLINVLTGFVPASSGRVVFAERRLDRMPAHRRVGIGLGRTFQTPQLCTQMSVLDNIVVGAHRRLGCAAFRRFLPGGERARLADLRVEAASVAEEVGIAHLTGVRADSLSYGHMRLLEIARALMARPCLLLLDEPVAGMNESESEGVAALLNHLRAQGLTVLLVEHDMNFVMTLCDRISVLNHGVLLADGAPDAIRRDRSVQEAYLGSAA